MGYGELKNSISYSSSVFFLILTIFPPCRLCYYHSEREKRHRERSICISSIITVIVVVNTHSLGFVVPLQKQDTEGGGERELAG